MKSLEARLADRAKREAEAEEQRQENAGILTDGSGAEGGVEGGEEGEYSTFTVEQLKEELDSRGLEYKASAKKADLVAMLEDNDAEG